MIHIDVTVARIRDHRSNAAAIDACTASLRRMEFNLDEAQRHFADLDMTRLIVPERYATIRPATFQDQHISPITLHMFQVLVDKMDRLERVCQRLFHFLDGQQAPNANFSPVAALKEYFLHPLTDPEHPDHEFKQVDTNRIIGRNFGPPPSRND